MNAYLNLNPPFPWLRCSINISRAELTVMGHFDLAFVQRAVGITSDDTKPVTSRL